jgi:hypothetical protein
MASIYTIKQHDNYPSLVLTLTDQNGPINLSTATTVKLILKSGTTTITGTCNITTPTSGIVTYVWAAGDTSVVGTYDGEVEITWNTGKIETVPNDSYFTITVFPDLG